MPQKKCKYCQTEIDQKAKICPNCKKDQRNWFIKHPIITGFLVLMFIVLIVPTDSSESTNNTNTTQTTETAVNETPTENTPEEVEVIEPEVINVYDLTADFDANQVAAEKKWNGKYVQFNAKVSNITDYGISFTEVTAESFSFTSITCRIKDKNQLLEIKNGENITVRGIVRDQSIGSITVSDCEIVN